MPVLSVVNEDSKPDTPSSSEIKTEAEINGTNEISEEGGVKKKKFTRSASIVEEMENRILPEVKIWKEYEAEGWSRLSQKHKEFAMDCGQR